MLDLRGLSGAGNGVRTRDPQLGKLVLYQLSYSRPAISGRPTAQGYSVADRGLEVKGFVGVEQGEAVAGCAFRAAPPDLSRQRGRSGPVAKLGGDRPRADPVAGLG